MKSKQALLYYHVFAINNWKEISNKLLADLPHDSVVVHISFTKRYVLELLKAYRYFSRQDKVVKIFISYNNKYPEVAGFNKFRRNVDLSKYEVLSYMHSKGVTKPDNRCVADWREYMRYFLVERHEECLNLFRNKEYCLYGVNLCKIAEGDIRFGPKLHSDFWYRGNFVTVNLNLLLDKVLHTKIDEDYYGMEGFWGKLCEYEKAYSAHNSGISHYDNRYGKEKYT